MAPLSNHASISITRDSLGVKRANSETPMMVSYSAAWAERHREYEDVAGVEADFPDPTSVEVRTATAVFSQNPQVEKLFIGRGANKPTLQYTMSLVTPVIGSPYLFTVKGEGITDTDITVTPLADLTFTADNTTETLTSAAHGMATGDGPYRLTNSGGALPTGLSADTNYWIIVLTANTYQLASSYANAIAETEVTFTTDGTGTHTLQRDANDVMVAQIVDRLNSVVGNNYLAAQVAGGGDTDTLTITGDAAGDWFSVKTDPNTVTSYLSHADPGVAADLSAIAAETDDWYCLITNFNSNALVVAADAWIASREKIYVFDTPNTVSVNGAVGGAGQDSIDNIKTLSRARTMGGYHPSPADMLAAAWVGDVLSLEPGSESWKFRQLTGVSAVTLTATQRANLRAKNGNSYETVAGVDITFEGTTGDGDFMDVQRGLDALKDDMGKALLEGMVRASNVQGKIPMTNAGAAQIEGIVRGSLKKFVDIGFLADDPKYVVTVPKIQNVSAADKAVRNLPDVKFSATLAGAIHKVTVVGVVSL